MKLLYSLNLVSSRIILGKRGLELPSSIILSTFSLITIKIDLIKAKSLSNGVRDSLGVNEKKILSIIATLTTKLTFPIHKLDK